MKINSERDNPPRAHGDDDGAYQEYGPINTSTDVSFRNHDLSHTFPIGVLRSDTVEFRYPV
jgi:hypothetical protein